MLILLNIYFINFSKFIAYRYINYLVLKVSINCMKIIVNMSKIINYNYLLNLIKPGDTFKMAKKTPATKKVKS